MIIDVSAAQGIISWQKVARWVGVNGERVDGVIVKASEGNGYVDKRLSANSSAASLFGILLGYYHYSHPDLSSGDARLEAKSFVSSVSSHGYVPGRHLLALDIEEARKVRPGPDFVNWVLEFCATVSSETSYQPFIYTGGPFWGEHAGHFDADMASSISAHPLWFPAYVPKIDVDRFIPSPWKDIGWTIWQRSGDVSAPDTKVLRLPGIFTNVDRNELSCSVDELHVLISDLRL